MNPPLVTVIIPAYNCAHFISNAIDSVLRQTYGELELIVVDDGSRDRILDVATKYQGKLQYIRQENGGVSKARNTGIRHAQGTYVSFLDADDAWEDNKLEIQMACFRRHPEVDFIFSGFHHIKNHTRVAGKSYEDTFNVFREHGIRLDRIFENRSSIDHGKGRVEFYWGNIHKYLFLGNFILPSSVIFRKDALDAVGLLNENYRVAEETEFFLRFSKSGTMGFVNAPLLYYETPDPENLSGKKNTEKLIRNALRIQIDSLLANPEAYGDHPGFFQRGLSMTYCRLAYYYLSEYRLPESRRYAIYGIRSDKWNPRPYPILALGFLTRPVLETLAKLKQRTRGNPKPV